MKLRSNRKITEKAARNVFQAQNLPRLNLLLCSDQHAVINCTEFSIAMMCHVYALFHRLLNNSNNNNNNKRHWRRRRRKLQNVKRKRSRNIPKEREMYTHTVSLAKYTTEQHSTERHGTAQYSTIQCHIIRFRSQINRNERVR